jgi:4-amino-4-deoxy-L-arabinose transferase-like glycosyltransferase
VTTRSQFSLVAAFALLVPVLLTLLVFPTAMVDLSENFAGGRFFTLTNPEHPPMQLWASGLLSLIAPPSATAAVLANQILNAIAALYVFATLKPLVGTDRAALFAFLLATSAYFVAAPLSYGLTADPLQLPVWAAITFHTVRAAGHNKWRDWILLGVWVAAGIYTKYSIAILLGALVAATLLVPLYRQVWRNPRLYVAMVIAAAIVAPHAWALISDASAIGNAEQRVHPDASLWTRLVGIGNAFAGIALYLAPGTVIVALGLWGGDFHIEHDKKPLPAVRFLRALFAAAFGLTALLIVALGIPYIPRYDAPLFPLAALASATFVVLPADRWASARRKTLWSVALISAAILVVATVTYTVFTSHNFMQEPIAKAEAEILAEWDREFSCGPAYVIGDRSTAHGMSMSGHRVTGIPLSDVSLVPWFAAEAMKEKGAILAFRRPVPAEEIQQFLGDVEVEGTHVLTLPLLRTQTGETITYHYAFVPPAGCPDH